MNLYWRIGAMTMLAALVLAGAACAGGQEGVPSPRATPGTPTPLVGETPTPATPVVVTPVQPTGLRLLYREFAEDADTLWLADPAQPQQRALLARIAHARGLGVPASLSPDGSTLAYTVVPVGKGNANTEAELWVLDILSGDATKVAEALELSGTPVWAPDGSFLIVRRRPDPATVELVQVDLPAGRATVLASEKGLFGLFAIGVSPDASTVYYASIAKRDRQNGPTTFWAVPAGGGSAQKVVDATEGAARNWQLSPDGQRVVYLAYQGEPELEQLRTFIARLADGTVSLLMDDPVRPESGNHFGPVWTPEGDGVTFGRSLVAAGANPAITVNLQGEVIAEEVPPDSGFDLPLAWSPDGRFLAALLFDAQRPPLVIVGKDGQRMEIGPGLTFIAWLAAP